MVKSQFALVPLTLAALAACAPSSGEHSDGDSTPPVGYELALAKPAAVQVDASTVIDLSPAQLQSKLEAGDIRLIDVRRADEVAQGIIPGAEHIALDEFDPAQFDPADTRAIVLYCRTGRRSRIAGERLASFTGEPAEHLAGGIYAWRDAGMPIVQP